MAEYRFQICGSPSQRYTHNKCCRWRNVAAWREPDHYRNYKRLAICHSYQNSGIIMCSTINDYIHCSLSLPFSVTVIQVYPLSHMLCLYDTWLLGQYLNFLYPGWWLGQEADFVLSYTWWVDELSEKLVISRTDLLQSGYTGRSTSLKQYHTMNVKLL